MTKQKGQESDNKRAKWGAKAGGIDAMRQGSNLSTNLSKDDSEPSGGVGTNDAGSINPVNQTAGSHTLASEISQHSN
jgi:hypothetical protein